MPDFTISVTVAQAQQVSQTFGRLLNLDDSPASAEQVLGWIKDQLREVVRRDREKQARGTVASVVAADMDTEGWNAV